MSSCNLKFAGRAALIVAALTAASVASAVPISFITPSGSTTSGGSVSAQADFTLSTTAITLVLQNLQANLIADSQELSGIRFDVGGATGSGLLTTVNSGNISTINTITNAYTAGVADALTRWKVNETGTILRLTTLTGGQPDRLIMGLDNMSGFDPNVGQYTNANPSVSNHNPNVLGSATFSISVPGVSTASQISNVVFEFGTETVPEPVNAQLVPEPSTLAGLLVAMIVGLGVAWCRRRK